jgi:hypothetical protein
VKKTVRAGKRKKKSGKRTSGAEKKKLIKQLDEMIKAMAFQRDGFTCQKCGKDDVIQPHHVIRRANKRVRWDIHNIITLCKACHFAQLQRPTVFNMWFALHYPERWKYLSATQNEIFKVNIQSLVAKVGELGLYEKEGMYER